MPRNKVLAETGKRPEDLTQEERTARLMATPQFQKHMKELEAERDDNPSTAYKSKQRLSRSAAAFLGECLDRGRLFNGEDKVYDNLEELKKACTEYVEFCIKTQSTMTITSLALWLGVSTETIKVAVNSAGLDSRFSILRNVKQIMEYLLEHELMNYEGNPSGRIFLAKSRFEWQEQPATINLNIGAQPTITPEGLAQLVESTPDDIIDIEDYKEI